MTYKYLKHKKIENVNLTTFLCVLLCVFEFISPSHAHQKITRKSPKVTFKWIDKTKSDKKISEFSTTHSIMKTSRICEIICRINKKNGS